MSLLYGVRYTDMCAFRAIGREALARLDMRETTYGWNIEMQMKAARAGLRILEVPVPYRCRAGGSSKVAGTLGGSVRAGLAHRGDDCADRACQAGIGGDAGAWLAYIRCKAQATRSQQGGEMGFFRRPHTPGGNALGSRRRDVLALAASARNRRHADLARRPARRGSSSMACTSRWRRPGSIRPRRRRSSRRTCSTTRCTMRC